VMIKNGKGVLVPAAAAMCMMAGLLCPRQSALGQTPTAGAVPFTLEGDFTLSWLATTVDVRSAVVRARQASNDRRYSAELKQRGRDTEALQRERAAEQSARVFPTKTVRMTISRRGHRLLAFWQDAVAGKPGQVHITTYILDGAMTYRGDFFESAAAARSGRWDPVSGGFLFVNRGTLMTDILPLPGVGFPELPLLRNGHRTTDSAGAPEIRGESLGMGVGNPNGGWPSVLRLAGKGGSGHPMSCTLLLPNGRELQRWDYAGFRPFAGVAIAGRTTFSNGIYVETFRLLSATAKSLPADRFRLDNWLLKGGDIQLNIPNQSPYTFTFAPRDGSVEDQIAGHWAAHEQAERQARQRSLQGNYFSAAFILATIALFALRIARRRRRR